MMDRNIKVAHFHVLNQVQKAITTQDANFNTLYSLLLLVMPQLKREDMTNKKIRLQAVKELLRQIHPLNFPGEEKAKITYEGLQSFYDRSCERYLAAHNVVAIQEKENAQPKRVSEKSMQQSLLHQDGSQDPMRCDFFVGQKWKYLGNYCRPLPITNITTGKILAPLVAYQCINARGSIAHGRRPSLIYSWDNVMACSGLSVLDIFAKYGGHVVISDVKSIKAELMHGGPVVSTTFIPDEKIAKRYSASIIESRLNKYHYCLIVGWTGTSNGEVWLVQNYQGNAIIHVPIGRHHIEDIVVFPKNRLDTLTWQNGPYLDRDMSKVDGWLEMNSVELVIKTHELELLAEVFDGHGLHHVMANKERFVLRDMKIQSKSRSCILAEVIWDKHAKVWIIKCQFTDDSYPD